MWKIPTYAFLSVICENRCLWCTIHRIYDKNGFEISHSIKFALVEYFKEENFCQLSSHSYAVTGRAVSMNVRDKLNTKDLKRECAHLSARRQIQYVTHGSGREGRWWNLPNKFGKLQTSKQRKVVLNTWRLQHTHTFIKYKYIDKRSFLSKTNFY